MFYTVNIAPTVNVLHVLYVLHVLHVLHTCASYMCFMCFICPWTHHWPARPCFPCIWLSGGKNAHKLACKAGSFSEIMRIWSKMSYNL